MKLMSSLDLVIAITTALQNWDGTPDQAASKLGEAIMAIRQYKIDNGWPVEIEEPAESAPAPREELPKASADCIESGTYRHYTPEAPKDGSAAPWRLELLCCGHHWAIEKYATWAQADNARKDWEKSASVDHPDRRAIVTESGKEGS